jgi:hypothetical protein
MPPPPLLPPPPVPTAGAREASRRARSPPSPSESCSWQSWGCAREGRSSKGHLEKKGIQNMIHWVQRSPDKCGILALCSGLSCSLKKAAMG